MKIPEILAPAGDWNCLKAAVENGANAVYFGLQCGFNARARAANFQLDELDDIIAALHARGVKGFVTLNTLVFTAELDEFEAVVRRVAASQADAVLVQDLGALSLIHRICPDLPIHASTQMTLTSGECIREVESLGVERVVLARELSIDEIRDIHEKTEIELEAFVHGALCVAYSGQCLTSESLGGRSANRGQCAQACRLPYELICDGQDIDLGDMKYLLSPQDLAAYALTPELLEAGVCSLKIEGRLKTPEYVANITRHYRDAVDQAVENGAVFLNDQAVEEMELSFSRGFSPGWLQGCDHKMLVPGLSSAKRGVRLGRVEQVRQSRISVRLEREIKKGDGVVLEGDRANDEEQGGRVYEVFLNGRPSSHPVASGVVELTFQKNAIDFHRVEPGQLIWKTDDPKLAARLRKSYNAADPIRCTPIHIEAIATVDQPLQLDIHSQYFDTITLTTDESLPAAKKHVITEELLREQLGRLGGVEFELQSLTLRLEGRPMAPLSVLGRLRKQLVAALREAMQDRPERHIASSPVLPQLRSELQTGLPQNAGSVALVVLCRTLPQLRCVLDQASSLGVQEVMADFQDIREYGEAADMAHAASLPLWIATPRIQKPGEMGVFRAMHRHAPHGFLVRNLSGMRFCADHQLPFIADYSLNAANELTVDWLLSRGAQRVTASYDLNRDQLLELVQATPARSQLEVVVHQHMPMFHMEHCVFCAVLSPGTNKTNCGRPCDDHLVELRDRVGVPHPLTADVGCRNTLFNATPQSGAEAVAALGQKGVHFFRVELLRETNSEMCEILRCYRQLIDGRLHGKEVWKRLNASNRIGITRGALESRRDPLAIL